MAHQDVVDILGVGDHKEFERTDLDVGYITKLVPEIDEVEEHVLVGTKAKHVPDYGEAPWPRGRAQVRWLW